MLSQEDSKYGTKNYKPYHFDDREEVSKRCFRLQINKISTTILVCRKSKKNQDLSVLITEYEHIIQFYYF